MKRIIVGIWFALYGLAQTPPERGIVVCIERVGNTEVAERVASEIFGEIGVELEWRYSRDCPERGIRIALTMNTPARHMPGALAYTTPYGAAYVRVFYDRVLDTAGGNRAIAGALLGHVLAHEIGHVLQGISRHSEAGVMKANWQFRDVLDMALRRLSFAALDETLIVNGMEPRGAGRTERVATQ